MRRWWTAFDAAEDPETQDGVDRLWHSMLLALLLMKGMAGLDPFKSYEKDEDDAVETAQHFNYKDLRNASPAPPLPNI